jgi:hypothetical protein
VEFVAESHVGRVEQQRNPPFAFIPKYRLMARGVSPGMTIVGPTPGAIVRMRERGTFASAFRMNTGRESPGP